LDIVNTFGLMKLVANPAKAGELIAAQVVLIFQRR
jgi:hypothetical protein